MERRICLAERAASLLAIDDGHFVSVPGMLSEVEFDADGRNRRGNENGRGEVEQLLESAEQEWLWYEDFDVVDVT